MKARSMTRVLAIKRLSKKSIVLKRRLAETLLSVSGTSYEIAEKPAISS